MPVLARPRGCLKYPKLSALYVPYFNKVVIVLQQALLSVLTKWLTNCVSTLSAVAAICACIQFMNTAVCLQA